MIAHTEKSFEPLPMRVRTLVPTPANQYQVISRSGEIHIIEATSAYEAFVQSGFSDSIKIARISQSDIKLLDESKFSDVTAEAEHAAAAEQDIEHKFNELKHHKNPLISASDLHELMQVWQEKNAADQTVSHSQTAPQAPLVSSSIGLDVQGDGFDEILPPTQPAIKAATPAPSADSITLEDAPAEPAEASKDDHPELSAEEIEKLLRSDGNQQ